MSTRQSINDEPHQNKDPSHCTAEGGGRGALPAGGPLLRCRGPAPYLRLDLYAVIQRLAQLPAELQRLSLERSTTLDERLDAPLETVQTPIAIPLVHLLIQQHLTEQEAKELNEMDLLATSRQLLQALAPAVLDPLESIGTVEVFDPDRSQPFSQVTPLGSVNTVRMRIPDITLKGKVPKTTAVEHVSHDAPPGDASIGS